MTTYEAGSPLLTRAVAWLRAGRSGLFLLALLVGAGAGLGAVAFRYLINFVTWLATGHSEFGQAGRVASSHLPWLGLGFFVVIPAIGGLLYGPLIYNWAREARGHGVPEVMIAVADNGGRIRWQVAVVKSLASAICIGSGGSVGREGPIVQIGSALASSVGQWVKMPENRLRIMVACGAAGGISATFNAPITGVFFGVEIILREFAVDALFTVMLSAMIADAVAIPFLGDKPFLSGFPAGITLQHPRNYLLVALLAVIAALIFAPSLFIGVTTGMAYGGIVDHLFGAGAGQPALYAVVAMGAVFTSAARAPLTSLASVLEMTSDFSLTLPVMLAIAIATTVSRALSYGTIYTTKLLRRGTDIDRAAPWRAVQDLKIADVMRPFPSALPVPPEAGAVETSGPDGAGRRPAGTALPGPVTYRHDVQTLFASESLGQALRQLAVYGRDGLPVVSPDEQHLEGWVTSAGVLRALAHQVAGTAAETAQAQAAAEWEPDGAQTPPERPSVPLPGYYVAEILVTGESPAAGRKLDDVSWPPASIPVSVLRGGSLRQPHRDVILGAGDRVSLLIPAARDTEPSGTEPSGTESRSVELPR